jgi:hypothetical protein
MPLPESHVRSLEAHLKVHEDDTVELREMLAVVSREIERREAEGGRDPSLKPEGIPGLIAQRAMTEQKIARHETLLALGRDHRSLDTLGELLENPELAREAARDPILFAKARGIEVPSNMAVDLEVSENRIKLQVTYYDNLAPFMVTWTNDGFTPPLAGVRQQAPEPPTKAD